ncbi:hypothetical protein BU15DRAFT_74857 [Melanogaster broomeanus]|nr:hypothetical protein BU15DRAFT_74857 [Melanogaster broomeanus]
MSARNNADRLAELETAARRRIKDLEDEVERLRSGNQSKRSQTSTIVNKGRAYRRVICLIHSPSDLVREYDRRSALSDEGLDSEQDPFPHSSSQDRLYRAFQEMIEFMPWIQPKLTSSEPDELEEIYKDLRKGADGARGDDASSMKQSVVTWLGSLYLPVDPPLSPTMKSDRGLDHDTTGRLLSPIEYDWDDMEVRKNVRERHPAFLVTCSSWPRFMYDVDHEYNPDNIEAGLFKSTLLLKAFKLIFTSPTSAQEVSASDNARSERQGPNHQSPSDKTTRSNVASLIGMHTVKPRAIAYAAVQLRFSLSCLTSWRMVDANFDSHTFYFNIIDFFEDAPGPAARARVKELLLWWDRKVFGRNRDIVIPQEQSASLTVSRMLAQRIATEGVAD